VQSRGFAGAEIVLLAFFLAHVINSPLMEPNEHLTVLFKQLSLKTKLSLFT
jgi:hypothetical protein